VYPVSGAECVRFHGHRVTKGGLVVKSKTTARQRLYAFKSRRDIDRSAWKIKPTGYIDTVLIE
jgi:hypothetical protein